MTTTEASPSTRPPGQQIDVTHEMLLDAFVERTLQAFLESGASEMRIKLSGLDHGDAAHIRKAFGMKAKKPNGSPGVTVTAGPKFEDDGKTCIVERGCVVLTRGEALPPVLALPPVDPPPEPP